MSVKIHYDKRKWDEIRRGFTTSAARVKVGVLVDSTHAAKETAKGAKQSQGISMLELAAIHEFGSPAAGIPQRSFIRATVDGKRSEINEQIEAIVGRAIKSLLARDSVTEESIRESVKKSLGLLGAKVVSMMRATIRANIPPPLRPATIARKGSSTALVDTGQLINVLSWSVIEGAASGDDGPSEGEKQAAGESFEGAV